MFWIVGHQWSGQDNYIQNVDAWYHSNTWWYFHQWHELLQSIDYGSYPNFSFEKIFFLNSKCNCSFRTQYKTLFGYCPQVDALNTYMTAYEILKYMAWIRGTPRHRIHREVEKWLKRMDLARYKHIKIKFYSGGTKRKLNTAIAMVSFSIEIFSTSIKMKSKKIHWTFRAFL